MLSPHHAVKFAMCSRSRTLKAGLHIPVVWYTPGPWSDRIRKSKPSLCISTMKPDFDSCFDQWLDVVVDQGLLHDYHSPTLLLPVTIHQKRPGPTTMTKPTRSQSTRKTKRKQCCADGCTNFAQLRGMCKAHGGISKCRVHGCTHRTLSKGVCFKHGGGKHCTVPHCHRSVQQRGFCHRHHAHTKVNCN